MNDHMSAHEISQHRPRRPLLARPVVPVFERHTSFLCISPYMIYMHIYIYMHNMYMYTYTTFCSVRICICICMPVCMYASIYYLYVRGSR